MRKLFYIAFLWVFIMGNFLPGLSQITDSKYEQKLRDLYSFSVPLISVEALEKKLSENGDLIILDTRSKGEYKVSHIKNAVLIDYDDFKKKDVKDLNRKEEIVVYCSVGYRSEKIGEQLKEMGFTRVYNLYGGIFEWVNQNKPVYNINGSSTLEVHTYSKKWSVWLNKGIRVYE